VAERMGGERAVCEQLRDPEVARRPEVADRLARRSEPRERLLDRRGEPFRFEIARVVDDRGFDGTPTGPVRRRASGAPAPPKRALRSEREARSPHRNRRRPARRSPRAPAPPRPASARSARSRRPRSRAARAPG
jgi:hypothetical protein